MLLGGCGDATSLRCSFDVSAVVVGGDGGGLVTSGIILTSLSSMLVNQEPDAISLRLIYSLQVQHLLIHTYSLYR